MNEPDLPVSVPVDTQDTTESLRRQINLLLGAMLISSFTLTLYLGLQGRRASAELAVVRFRATEQFKVNQQDIAAIQQVYVKLADFGRTHPDFQKRILSRFQFNTNGPAEPPKK